MRFKHKGKTYSLSLKKRIIPVGLSQIIDRLNNEPSEESPLVVDGSFLEGKIAIVTGAYKGIGYSIAKRLLQDGAKVIITGRNEEQLKASANKLNTDSVAWMKWDIADRSNCISYLNEAEKFFGPIDILVNNAGVSTDRKGRVDFDNMDKVHFHYIHDINTLGTRQLCMSFIERYGKGTILNILSNTSLRPAQDAYFTSKWALRAFTEAMGLSNERKNVTINGLCPGPIKTDMSFGPGVSMYRKEIPNRRIGMPEEVAELAFVQVLSGLSGTSGQITVCDGGEILN